MSLFVEACPGLTPGNGDMDVVEGGVYMISCAIGPPCWLSGLNKSRNEAVQAYVHNVRSTAGNAVSQQSMQSRRQQRACCRCQHVLLS